MERYKNKYRIPSARATWWNYGWAGAYFITICTHKRRHLFGEIINRKMHLSHLGILADVLWHEIPHHFPNVELGAFVVMPNHIHGILILNPPFVQITPNNNVQTTPNNNVQTTHALSNDNTNTDNGNDNDNGNVETTHALSLQTNQSEKSNPSQQRFQNQGKNTISSIIGSYKSAVTKHANRLGLENGWQTRFHDHIIRNDDEFQRITDYIKNNPLNWEKDKFYK